MHSGNMKRLLAKPWLLPDEALIYFFNKVTSFIRLKTDSFGWAQAILYSRRVDEWLRYQVIAEQIRALDNPKGTIKSIVDVGGGPAYIMKYINPRDYYLCVLDINIESLKKSSSSFLDLVGGDACDLPFKDSSFDIATSVDSLEHVPDPKKAKYCAELKRVAKSWVIIHCPADSADGQFQGTLCDTKFLQWYRRRFKSDESNTSQHLSSGLPKVEELKSLFPGARIMGSQNAEAWLKYMRYERIPYLGFITGLIYKFSLKKIDNTPPYHSQYLIWEKI